MEINLTNGALSATIRDTGAELVSLKKNGKEYMWSGDPAFWGKHSPVLFPIVGTLKDNSYTHDGKNYSLPRHGFARESNFSVIDHTESRATFLLKADNVTYEVYPFDFELTIEYLLDETGLNIRYNVKNLGSADMPFSLGAHPAFALERDIESYSLYFEDDAKLTRYKLESDLVSNSTEVVNLKHGKLPLSYDLFKDNALVMKQLNSKAIEIFRNDKKHLKIAYQNFPHMGLWTKPGAPFICIEPWQGYADTPLSNGNLVDKEGIVNLQTGHEKDFMIKIEISG